MNIESKIQLLADGELDHASRAELLEAADSRPELWKKISFAFVERQIMTESLSDLSLLARDRCELLAERKPTANADDVSTVGLKRWFWVAGLAACLMVGAMFGYGLNSGIEKPPLVQIKKDAVKPSSIGGLDLADAIERSAAPLPKEFRLSLLKAGYRVEEKRRFEQVALPIGGSVEIPTRNVEITYVGLSAYQ